MFVVSDDLEDPCFMCSPLVTTDPKVRFYAAAPILTDDGCALDVVCTVDSGAETIKRRAARYFSIIGTTSRGKTGDEKTTD